MIVAIEGEVVHKEPTLAHIKCQGLTYGVNISLNTYAQINDKNTSLHIKQVIREDANLLYGFFDQSEMVLFERLIKISGVGPKVGLAICSSFTPQAFSSVISGSDINSLKKVPGIGPKSAGRILVELNGFDEVLVGSSGANNSTAYNESVMALESLGFKNDIITKTLATCTSSTTSELVREALKKLQK